MWRRMKKGRADTCNYRIIGFCVDWDTTKKRSAMTMILTMTSRAMKTMIKINIACSWPQNYGDCLDHMGSNDDAVAQVVGDGLIA